MAISKSEASAMSAMQVAVLEQAEAALGNPRLRRMSVLEVRRLLRKALIADPITKAKWDAYESEWKERERTYATAHVRGFERGERGGRV